MRRFVNKLREFEMFVCRGRHSFLLGTRLSHDAQLITTHGKPLFEQGLSLVSGGQSFLRGVFRARESSDFYMLSYTALTTSWKKKNV